MPTHDEHELELEPGRAPRILIKSDVIKFIITPVRPSVGLYRTKRLATVVADCKVFVRQTPSSLESA